jgi:cytochrome c556
MKACKLTLIALICSLIVITVMTYKFIISGETVAASDGRQAILLEPGERDLVLGEMRLFLQTVQQITQGVSENNMGNIVTAAKQVGAAAQQAVPASLMKKLPLEFKKLGFDTHSKFDQLALDAEQFEDPKVVLDQLTSLMTNCVACHEIYRIDPAPTAMK